MDLSIHHISQGLTEKLVRTNAKLKVHIRVFDRKFFAQSEQPYKDMLRYYFQPSALQYWPAKESSSLLRHLAEGDLTVSERDPRDPTKIVMMNWDGDLPRYRVMPVPMA